MTKCKFSFIILEKQNWFFNNLTKQQIKKIIGDRWLYSDYTNMTWFMFFNVMKLLKAAKSCLKLWLHHDPKKTEDLTNYSLFRLFFTRITLKNWVFLVIVCKKYNKKLFLIVLSHKFDFPQEKNELFDEIMERVNKNWFPEVYTWAKRHPRVSASGRYTL